MNQPGTLAPYHIRNIAVDLVLTLVTCGIYNVFIQYKQILAVNAMLRQEKYSFVPWFLLSLITCGLYHVYHEYRVSEDIARILEDRSGQLPLISLLLSLFGLSFVADAIQQSKINEHFGDSSL